MDLEENANKVIKDLKDNSYKKLFDNPELFTQFIKHFSNIDLLKNIKPEDILDCTDRYVALYIEQKDTDTVKIVEVKKDIFIIAMIEHQSKVCFDMPFRMLLYMVLLWHEWIKQKEIENKGSTKKKDFKLPPILPMVYYTGTNEWTAELNFHKSIYLNEEFSKYIPTFNYELVSLSKYSIEELMRYEDILSFMMILDKIKKTEEIKDILNKITEQYINKINNNIPDDLLQLIKDIVFLFLTKINVPKGEKEKVEKLIYERRFSDMLETIEYYDVQKERIKIRKELEGVVRKEVEGKVREELEGVVREEVEGKVRVEVEEAVRVEVEEAVRVEVEEARKREREKSVQKMIMKGNKIEDIADILDISIDEVKEIQNIHNLEKSVSAITTSNVFKD